ncbi:MAG: hypothetical protein CBE15_07995 [Euryarchaeota archaeon TMED255]|nr:MAG: hypothetical protein CBE15_07995 [Euryarchaeota archaeon TMED255]
MKMKKTLLIFLAPLFFQSFADAEQKLGTSEVESKEKPFDAELILRRQTLIVRDIEASLALYRDALGMEVIYDQEINRPHPSQDRTQKLRLIFLKATHSFVGVLGLIDYEYGYPDHPAHQKPVRHEGFTPGNSILIFNTTDLDAKWRSIVNKEGIKIISPPKLTKYPSYDGEGVLRVKVSKFYDPDGFLVELNQLLDPL